MKATAIILVSSILLLSMGNIPDHIQVHGADTEISCCADSCSGCCNSDEDQHDSSEPRETDKECPPACDCSAQFQLSALAFSFMETSGDVVQSYHYVRYRNTYSFEYSDNFLHPPRFG